MVTRIPGLLLLTAILTLVPCLQAQDEAGQPRSTKDGKFTIVREVERLPVLSQGRTGTCWSFATVSFLESELERIHKKPINLSEIYPVYFTYLEKAKRFLAAKGKTTKLGEGGLCHDIMHVIEHHGLALEQSYDGLIDGERQHDHAEMSTILAGMMKTLVGRRRISPKWEDAVRGVLDAYIGKVPTEVEVDGKTMTPAQYAHDVLKMIPRDYVEVMSYRYSPYWQRAKLTVPDNWMHDDNYLNVPLDTLMASLDKCLESGYSAALDMDVSEKGFKMGKGIATLPDELEVDGAITEELREEMFKNGKTTDDHLMHVVGIAKDKNGKRYYVTKNSWGKIGPYGGYLFMSRNFVALKMLTFMAHKKGLPAEIFEKIKP